MAGKMRLFHRRSSSSKDRFGNTQLMNLTAAANPRLQILGAGGRRSSMGNIVPPTRSPRPRSFSLFPGSETSNCLTVPQRPRSGSFSGDVGSRSPLPYAQTVLTPSEEDHVFRCYVRVMYMVLGMLGAGVLGLVLYAFHTSIIAPSLNI